MGFFVGGYYSINISVATQWYLNNLDATYFDVGAPTQTYACEIIFRTDGTIDILKDFLSDLNDEQNPYVTPTVETDNTWVQCTFEGTGVDAITGPTLGSWHRLTSQQAWRYAYTSSGGPDDTQAGTYIFKLASDAAGSQVEATATVQFDVGESV